MRTVFYTICHWYEEMGVSEVQSSDCQDGRQDIPSTLFWHCWWHFRMGGWMDTHGCALRRRILHLEFMLAGIT